MVCHACFTGCSQHFLTDSVLRVPRLTSRTAMRNFCKLRIGWSYQGACSDGRYPPRILGNPRSAWYGSSWTACVQSQDAKFSQIDTSFPKVASSILTIRRLDAHEFPCNLSRSLSRPNWLNSKEAPGTASAYAKGTKQMPGGGRVAGGKCTRH